MSDEERARFEVLLEDIRSQVQLVAEGHASLNANVNGVAARMERVENKVDKLDLKVDVLTLRVERLETDMHQVKGDMRQVKDHLSLNGAPASPKPTTKRKPRK